MELSLFPVFASLSRDISIELLFVGFIEIHNRDAGMPFRLIFHVHAVLKHA